MGTYYIAYGSNLNLDQMATRCPNAMVFGMGFLRDWKLAFNKVATIVPSKGDSVPVGVWIIDVTDERRLDMYEGFPHKYRKEHLEVKMYDGSLVQAMAYILNEPGLAPPSGHYYAIIEEGYDFVGLDKTYLEKALLESQTK